ncbi:hypothetical protein FRB90_001174 [Tulasnella sp. 427]|nr:hypothetical protein FRB90_001174 [Tulasnella sp. 427]
MSIKSQNRSHFITSSIYSQLLQLKVHSTRFRCDASPINLRKLVLTRIRGITVDELLSPLHGALALAELLVVHCIIFPSSQESSGTHIALPSLENLILRDNRPDYSVYQLLELLQYPNTAKLHVSLLQVAEIDPSPVLMTHFIRLFEQANAEFPLHPHPINLQLSHSTFDFAYARNKLSIIMDRGTLSQNNDSCMRHAERIMRDYFGPVTRPVCPPLQFEYLRGTWDSASNLGILAANHLGNTKSLQVTGCVTTLSEIIHFIADGRNASRTSVDSEYCFPELRKLRLVLDPNAPQDFRRIEQERGSPGRLKKSLQRVVTSAQEASRMTEGRIKALEEVELEGTAFAGWLQEGELEDIVPVIRLSS